MKSLILSVGNLYVETNFLGIETAGQDSLSVGHEYYAPVYETRLGGSAVNLITQLKKLGNQVGIIGKIGKDKTGETLQELLENEEINTDLIKISEAVVTNVDTGLIFEHNAQNIQVVAGSANQSLSLDDINLESKLFDNVKAVYFGGSFKQKHLWTKYPEMFFKLYSKGIKLFLDPGRVPVDADKAWVNVLKDILPMTAGYFPNDKEIMSVTDSPSVDEALSSDLLKDAELIVVKLGEKGCTIKYKSEITKIPGFKIKPVSTVGAGDVFNASFISEYLNGTDLKKCGRFANAAAALRVKENKQPLQMEVEDFLALSE